MDQHTRRYRVTLKSIWEMTICLTVLIACVAPISGAQQATVVPTLASFSGTLTDVNGKPLSGVVGVTFCLYKDEQGGSPLWIETQNVRPDKSGRYTVSLGAATSTGLPTDVFVSGEARWLGVQPEGQAEQPRVLLLSVPYALKAGDAETIGGLPASAFVLANGGQGNGAGPKTAAAPASAAATKNAAPPANPAVTGKGVVDYIPMWDTTSDIVDSVIFQKTSEIGIGTTTPAATLDVNGKSDIRDTLTLFPKSTDNTLAVSGTSFNVSSTGKITFITGQTFPGTGTITGITTASGSGLSGGGTTGTLSLKVPAAGITNAMLANSKITLNANTAGGLTTPGAMTLGSTYTMGLKPCSANQILQYSGTAWNCASAGTGTITGVTAGTDLTGGGTSGTVTLNLNTAKVPLLAAANTFTANQTVNGTVTATSIGNSIVGNTSGINGTGIGVIGNSTVTTGSSVGVLGETSSTGGSGVQGIALATTGNTFGVFGYSPSPTGYGVYGEANAKSGNPTGVYGTAQNGTGVYGTSITGSGTVGVSTAGGTGVSGTVPAGGTGVYGENISTSVGGDGILGKAHTSSGNGVHGVNDASTAVGVYGENSATNGYGVYGHAPSGYGMATDSNVSQARSTGGWVKAMVYINPLKGGIQRCFNSQLAGSLATTVPCGITYTYNSLGSYTVDFGFQVDDRFLQVASGPYENGLYNPAVVIACLDDLCGGSSTQVQIGVFSGGSLYDNSFFLTIF